MSANNIVRKGNNFVWKGAWVTSTAYAVNDSVQQNGSGYICLTAHTSGTFATDLAAGKWSLFVEGVGGNSIQVDCSGGTSDTYGVLSGLVNSSNTLYTVSLGKYVSGSLRVYLNGQLQTQGSSEDWTETTPASGTFTFATAPATGDIIIAMYQFSSGATGNADTLDGLHGSSYATRTGTETLTGKTIDGDDNTVQDLPYSAIKSTSRTGADAKLVTGTAGSGGNVARWNADGDIIGSANLLYDAGTQSCNTSSATTIYSCSAPGVYLVSVYYGANEANNPYFGFAVVSVDGTTRNKVHLSNFSASITITMSNLNIQVTQTSGITLTITWSVLRLI